ncbi:MAG: arylsulfatase [Dehalococcoidia bacterium]
MTNTPAESPPNIILILADDMGFSDIGCYGAEIRTPNLDKLAASGLRFTQMYNTARCCPSRASLLTGLYSHQAGVGHMVKNTGHSAYQGYLNDSCATVAEVLGAGGYRTLMSGKWHVGGDYDMLHPNTWGAGEPGHPTPTQRGFGTFYGTLQGAGSFFNPPTLMDGESFTSAESDDFYYTDAITDRAVSMIRSASGQERPFFQYVAYTAPHWPLHALEEDIARYEGMYRGGWDSVRKSRHEQMKGMGLLDRKWDISPRDQDAPPWESVGDTDWEDMRMAVYAAQIDRMDQGIGRIMSALEEEGIAENTLVMFLSDNGGCAEFLAEDTARPDRSQFDTPMANGGRMRMGNVPGLRPGPADTFMSYDLPWANASNTPFRLFKHWVHEGGISTPFIAYWPARIRSAGIVHEPVHIVDITATCIAAAHAPYPGEINGSPVTPLEGESLLLVFTGEKWSRDAPIFWEHEGNRAVRMGQWKLVSKHPGDWELYDMNVDRSELHDLAASNRPKVKEMAGLYEEWAARCGVLPWPLSPAGGLNVQGHNVHVV